MNKFDLSNKTIRISTRLNTYYTYDATVSTEETLDSENNTHIQYRLSHGYSVDLFLCLQFILNFSYVINPSVDIYDLKNSSGNDVDLYLAAFSLYKERALYADPTVVIGYSSVVALINHEFEDASKDVFTTTFSATLLMTITLVIVTFLLTLGFLARCEGIPWREAVVHGGALILRQEGFRRFGRNVSSRIAVLILSVFLMILSASFTGNMVSISAISKNEIKTVEDLLNSKYNILLELGAPNSTIRLMLERMSHIPNVRQLLSRINESQQGQTYKIIAPYIHLVENTATAYIIDLESGVDETEKHIGYMPCNWGTVPVFDLWYQWVMFMKKKSPYKPAINYGIIKLRETGSMDRIRHQSLPRRTVCKEETHTFQSISFPQVETAFVCFFVGFLSSLLFLVIENFVKYKLNQFKNVGMAKRLNFLS